MSDLQKTSFYLILSRIESYESSLSLSTTKEKKYVTFNGCCKAVCGYLCQYDYVGQTKVNVHKHELYRNTVEREKKFKENV